jgi:hypothetical protein
MRITASDQPNEPNCALRLNVALKYFALSGNLTDYDRVCCASWLVLV